MEENTGSEETSAETPATVEDIREEIQEEISDIPPNIQAQFSAIIDRLELAENRLAEFDQRLLNTMATTLEETPPSLDPIPVDKRWKRL